MEAQSYTWKSMVWHTVVVHYIHRRKSKIGYVVEQGLEPTGLSPCYCFRQYWIHLQYGGPVFETRVGKIPRRRAWQPTAVFLPGESLWTEEPGRLQSIGLQKTGHDWTPKHCCCLAAKLCLILLWPHGLEPVRLLCPWDFPDKNTWVGCQFLLQGIFPDPGMEPTSPALVGRFFF